MDHDKKADIIEFIERVFSKIDLAQVSVSDEQFRFGFGFGFGVKS